MTLFDPDPSESRDLLGDPSSSAIFIPAFLDASEATLLQDSLTKSVRWSRPSISFYGKTSLLPREVAWIADGGRTYGYSGVSSNPQPWPDCLADVRSKISDEAGRVFNSVLLNRYRNGDDTVSWHSDDERELGPNPTIASLSLGASRKFRLRHKSSRQTIDIVLVHGSLLVMSGRCQTDWEHQIPREKTVQNERLNLTFRWVYTHEEVRQNFTPR
jgi:alkylated DNA repair dioxygenase AlkB